MKPHLYFLSNVSAKNYENRLMCVEVIVCYTSVVFLRHSAVKQTRFAAVTSSVLPLANVIKLTPVMYITS